MTRSVDTSQPVSPATLSLPDELMHKVVIVAGLEVIQVPSDMDLYSPRLTWLWPLLSAQSASSYTEDRKSVV